MEKVGIVAGVLVAVGFVIGAKIIHSLQDDYVFQGTKLPKDHKFSFSNKNQIVHEEIYLTTHDREKLHALLFHKATLSQKVILYLHGNAGNSDNWGNVSTTFTKRGYDVMILDYRGYGKSGGEITCEKDLYSDIQVVYDYLKTRYHTERNIILVGTSIGTGLATKLARDNDPSYLILNSPYYSLTRLVKDLTTKYFPACLVKYKIRLNEYLKNVSCPITIFHGDKDEIIPVSHSLDLKRENPEKINLQIIKGKDHNGMIHSKEYEKGIDKILPIIKVQQLE